MTDRLTVRIVISTLAFVVVGGAAGMLLLVMTDHAIPDQLDRLVSMALGATAGVLAKTASAPDANPGEGGQSVLAIVLAIIVAAVLLRLLGII